MNVETALIKWLGEQLDCKVAAARPPNPPETMVTLERTGGPRESVASEAPMIAIQSWASSMEKAADLAYLVDKVMARATEAEGICRVDRESIYRFPGENREPRYQGTYQLYVRSCI